MIQQMLLSIGFHFCLLSLSLFLVKRFKIVSEEKDIFNELLCILIASICGIVFMSLPYSPTLGLALDLRPVLFSVIALYFGCKVMMPVCCLLFIYRLLSGGAGAGVDVAMILVLFPLCHFISPNFHAFTRKQKLVETLLGIVCLAVVELAVSHALQKWELASVLETATLVTCFLALNLIFGYIVFYEFEHTLRDSARSHEMAKTERLRMIAGLAALFAHYVRNPLTSIQGFQ